MGHHYGILAVLYVLTLGSGSRATLNGVDPVQDQIASADLSREACSGYVRGVNPRNRDSTGCVTGVSAGLVDHEQAFGFPPDKPVDWSSCDLPIYPDEK